MNTKKLRKLHINIQKYQELPIITVIGSVRQNIIKFQKTKIKTKKICI